MYLCGDYDGYDLEYRTALGMSLDDGEAVKSLADLLCSDGLLDEAIDGYPGAGRAHAR